MDSKQVKSRFNSSKLDQANGHSSNNTKVNGGIANGKSSDESRDVQMVTLLQSPVTVLLNQVPGAQSFYSLVASIFIIFLVFDEVKCYLNPQDRKIRDTFYYGQFSTLPVFGKIWLYMHMVVYLIVYPTSKLVNSIPFVKPGYILTTTAVASVALVKFIIWKCMKQASIEGNALSVTISLALACESVRIMMKIISYLVECSNEQTRSKANLRNLTYFLFAPTLLYQTSYPRTPGSVKWVKAIVHLAEFLMVVYMNGIWFKNFYSPNVSIIRDSIINNKPFAKHQLVQILFVCTMTSLTIYLSLAFGFLHSYFNFTAEALRHADRTFYKVWWNAMSPALMMRRWNYLIHSWIREYPFKALNSMKGKSTRVLAVTIVFILSGIYHDYVTFVSTGFFLPLFTSLMAVTGIFVVIDDYFKYLNPAYFNMFRNFFGLVQLGLLLSTLTIEYQVRLACPRDPSQLFLSDIVTLRSLRCLKLE